VRSEDSVVVRLSAPAEGGLSPQDERWAERLRQQAEDGHPWLALVRARYGPVPRLPLTTFVIPALATDIRARVLERRDGLEPALVEPVAHWQGYLKAKRNNGGRLTFVAYLSDPATSPGISLATFRRERALLRQRGWNI